MFKHRIISLILIAVVLAIGFFVYSSQFNKNGAFAKFPFRLGLDLNGGTQLTYKADVSNLASNDVSGAMSTLKDVIERRVNIFGVSEPLIQTVDAGLLNGIAEHRLVVELPGVTDIGAAISMIGKTPTLEFKLVEKATSTPITASTTESEIFFVSTGLTGRLLKNASLEFNQNTSEPVVSLSFNSEGKDLFAKITRENVGQVLAIFLDGEPISAPIIREEIKDGNAQISGRFSAQEARTLVRDLNYGALPVPIELIGTQLVGASLGQNALMAGVKAGVVGLIVLVLFLIFWYRLPGIVAVFSLAIYIVLSLALFKIIPVTLTAAGLAGFILSIGMAVDANVLIFERMKEELKKGEKIDQATREGFHRAWLSIRDSNISSIITSIVLFWLGTSAVKGFALTLGIGVLVSMLTAITISRTFLFAIGFKRENKFTRFLYSNGFHI